MSYLFFCRSPYNFFTTTYTINTLIKEAKKRDYKTLVLLETNTLAGSSEFIDACIKNKIKPIICLELFINNKFVWFIPLNNIGLDKLFKLSSFIFHNMKNINKSEFINENIKIIFPNLDNNYPFKKTTITNDFFNDLKSNLVLDNFLIIDKLTKDDYNIRQMLSNLSDNKTKVIFNSLEEALENDFDELLKGINYQINNKPKQLPNIEENQTFETFKSYCIQGLKKRIGSSKVPKVYYERLVKEMSIINQRNFSSYFLLFFDLVRFCRNSNILIGPGRGSAAGSLVSYCLYITNIDPIKNNLIFERFLNPMRSNLPDIDLDIEDINRDKALNYLYEKYGWNRVANITTYSTFGLKGAFREIGKNLGLNSYQIKEVSQHLPSTWEVQPLKSLLDNSNALLQQYVSNDKVKTALEIAEKIKNLPRHASIHAAGVILTNKKIYDILPIYINKDNMTVTQWKMEEIENWGIPKLDLLGLRNLTIIKNTLIAIEQNRKIKINIRELDQYDRKVFKLFEKAETEGIFQLESEGMRRVLKKIKPSSIQEIGLVSALYRPGAKEHINECTQNKFNPSGMKKIHPIIDEILNSTYGVLVYQEQVMEILVKFAGLTYGEADLMRRIISKKNIKGLNEVKNNFYTLAFKKGYNEKLITDIWNDIVQFAGYGFNKSHAIAYATISYWMGYLKVNYSLEFYNSLLTSFQMDIYKALVFKADAFVNFGITIIGPNLNISTNSYLIYGKDIIAPLNLIKNVGNVTIKNIIKERISNGPFIDYVKTIERLVNLKISENTIVNIIKSGATSDIKMSTKSQLINLTKVMQYIFIKSSQVNIEKPNLVVEKDKPLEVSIWEKEALGFNISRSIIQILESIEKNYTKRKLFMLKNIPNVEVELIVHIDEIIESKTKKGNKMLIIKLNDGIEQQRVYSFLDSLDNLKDLEEGYYKVLLKSSYANEKNSSFLNIQKILKKYII